MKRGQGEREGKKGVVMCTKLFSFVLFALPVLCGWVAMSYKRVKASKRTSRFADTHGHLYIGILSIDVSFGEVGEVVQIQEESSRAVPVYVAALCPGEGGRPVGQPLLRT